MTARGGTPALPTPDGKDWTWVLERACPDCGFDAPAVDARTVATRILATTPRWRVALAADGARLRPAPQVWSTTEYAAHVRDVHALFAARGRLILEEDDPEFMNLDQDETAVEARYWLAEPGEVAGQLAATAEQAAAVFAAPTDAQWGRTGRRSNGSVFTLETLARYYLHDVEHHLHDVGH